MLLIAAVFGALVATFHTIHSHLRSIPTDIVDGLLAGAVVLVAVLIVRHHKKETSIARAMCESATAKSHAIAEALEARALTDSIVLHSHIGMAFYRGDTGECVIVNPALCRMIGASLEQARSQRFRDIASWKASGLLELAEEALATDIPSRRQLHVDTSFGRSLHAECVLSRVVLGAAPHLLLMMMDVSDRVQSDQLFRKEAERNELYLDTVQSIVVSLDRRGCVTLLNKRGRELLGYQQEEIVGRNWFELCLPSPEGMRDIFPTFLQLIAGELGWHEHYDNLVVARDGSKVLIEWHNALVRDPQGNIVGTISSGIDVTSKRAAEAALRRNHELLARLLDLLQQDNASEVELLEMGASASLDLVSSPITCILSRTLNRQAVEFVVVFCQAGEGPATETIGASTEPSNPWRKLLGLHSPLIANEASIAAQFGNCAGRHGVQLQRLLAVPIVVRGEVVALAVVANKAACYDDSDVVQLTLLLESVWKRVEHRRDELALEVANRELQTALACAAEMAQQAKSASLAKSTFLANMSHEIRTPLNVVLGFTEMMRRDENLTKPQRENLAIIGRSGSALLTLINDILEVSKIEAGRQTLNVGSINLGQLAEELWKLFQADARQKGLDLVLCTSDTLPKAVVGDEGKIRQILVNLLGNAIKFTKRGTVKLAFDTFADTLHVVVTDTGAGIEQDALEDIFSAFTQSASGRSSHQGTGLGLTLSRALARLHGGDIAVKSAVNQGSTFTLSIPLRLPSAGTDCATLASPSPTLRRPLLAHGQPSYRILVADDDTFSRKLMERVLGPVGFELHFAADGIEAVEEYVRVAPDFVLMDMRMPRLDGSEAVARIRALEGEHRATIVGISGDAFEDDRRAALKCGCDDFIAKPFHLNDLFSMFQRLCGVSFVEAAESRISDAPPSVRESEDPMDLPDHFWRELRESTALGDIARIQVLLGEVEGRVPNLAAQMHRLVARFDLRSLATLVEKALPQ